MQFVSTALVSAFKQATRGRLCPAIRSRQMRTAFTIPQATITSLELEFAQGFLEELLTAIHDNVEPEALKTPAEIHIPNSLNMRTLLTGRHDLDNSLNGELALAVRHDTIRQVAASFAKRKDYQLATLEAKRVPGRFDNPLSALQSSPGGGKSTLLDMMGRLSSRAAWTPDLCPDDSMRAILNRSIPIPITFSNNTTWSPDTYDTSCERALALRILHSFFVRADALSLGAFASSVSTAKLPWLSVEDAIQACRAYMHMHCGDSRDNLLLLVDEARKTAGGDGTDTGLFSVMCTTLILFRYNQVNILSTTQDNISFVKGGSQSGGPTIWSSLNRLPQRQIEDMFLHAVQTVHPEHQHKLPVVPMQSIAERNARLSDLSAQAGYVPIEGSSNCHVLPAAVRIAISDCAGHPRSLEKLQAVFFDVLHEYQSVDDWTSKEKSSLRELRRRVVPSVRTAIVPPSVEAVRVALQGERMPLDTRIGKKSFAELITGAVFLNTGIEGNNVAVPKLSMLSLLLFADELDKDDPLRKCIESMAGQEEEAVLADEHRKCGRLEGKLFEKFIARWLELRLRVADKPVTVNEILHLPRGIRDSARNRTILTRDIEIVHRPNDNLSTLLASAPETLDASQVNKIILLGAGGKPGGGLLSNNPAFDIVAVLRGENRKNVALFLETRFSVAASRNSLDQGDFDSKLALIDSAAKQAQEVSSLGLKKSDLVCVSVLNRSVSPGIDIGDFLSKNVVVLDRAKVQQILTHSMADRALLLRDLGQE